MARRARYKTAQPEAKPAAVFEPIPELLNRRKGLINILGLMGFFCANLDARVTARQLMAFVYFAHFDALGEPKTLNDLRKQLPNLITRSLDVFLAPEREGDEEMLDWLYRETDPADARNKFIRLTERGKEACRYMTALIM